MLCYFIFFFKQKTAYEMRISDWSSDVCSSDLATSQVHEHQHQTLQEGFIHGPDDRAYLAMGNALLFPGCGGGQDDALQCVHHPSQGAGRTADRKSVV